MKKVMNCVIRIEYEHDTKGYWGDLDMSEVEDTAAHLAINPNFHSIECGVKIDEVSVNVNERNMKEITVEQLCEMCKEQVKAGNGKKMVLMSDDEECNGFHPIYEGFTAKEYFFGGKYPPNLPFGIKPTDDFIILG